MPREPREKLEAKDWIKEIDLGIEFREKVGQSKNWAKYNKYYVGDFKKGLVPVNLIFANGKIMVPKCYFRNPRVKVVAKKPKYWYSARVTEAADNYLIKELRMKWTMKKTIEDTYTAGIGFNKLGYDSEYGFPPDTEEDTTVVTEKGLERNIEYNMNIKRGFPWLGRVEPPDIIVPWGTISSGDPEITGIPWMAHRFVRHIDDAIQDKKYEKKAIAALKDKGGTRRPDVEYKRNTEREEDTDYIEMFEIKDYATGKIIVVAREFDEFFVNQDDELQIEGFNYTRLVFNTHPKYFWPISDIKNLEPLQLSLNLAFTILDRHVRLSLKKLLVERDTIKQAELDKLTSDVIAAAILVDGNPGECLKDFNITVPQELYQYINECRKTLRELVGYSRNEAGEFDQSSRRTATEANLVKQGSETRSSERRDQVADVFERNIAKMNQIIFTHWGADNPQVARVIGEDGVQYWVEYTGEDIKGEYDLEINAEEAQPIDSARMTEDALALLQNLAQDEDFSSEEKKNVKRALYAQFTHLGFDLEKALAPKEGMGMNPEQPIPMNEWANKMDKGKQDIAGKKAQAGVEVA